MHYNLQILDGPQHMSFDFSEAIFFSVQRNHTNVKPNICLHHFMPSCKAFCLTFLHIYILFSSPVAFFAHELL